MTNINKEGQSFFVVVEIVITVSPNSLSQSFSSLCPVADSANVS
jgi:hypothetical protein